MKTIKIVCRGNVAPGAALSFAGVVVAKAGFKDGSYQKFTEINIGDRTVTVEHKGLETMDVFEIYTSEIRANGRSKS